MGNAHVGRDIGQYRWLVEIASTLSLFAANKYLCALVYCILDERSDGVLCLLFNQRTTSYAVFEAIAEVECADLLGELLGEFFSDGLVNDEAVSGSAGFTNIAHLRAHCTFDSLVDVGVFKDDEWCVTAEFHRGAQDIISSCLEQSFADWRGASERHLAKAGVCHYGSRDC